MSALVVFLVAINPPAIAAALARSVTLRAIAIAALLSAALVTLAAGLSEPLLDLLDVSPPTFRVAAGVVLSVAGIRWVVVGARPILDHEPSSAMELLPLFVPPQLVAIAITVGIEDGVATAAIAGAVALLVAVIAASGRGKGLTWWSWAARLVGLAGVAVGLALVVDGVKTV
jgi:small neutral amino acid transporter SnatA (MarC family)